MSEKVITRFAPSPTGTFHIGSARTALFNFVITKNLGGEMLLRIEDTDTARNTEESLNSIIDGLEWLGIKPTHPLILQSSNTERHIAAARQLVAERKAFYCYCSGEESREMGHKYGGKCRGIYDIRQDCETKPVIRLDSSAFEEIRFSDRILGESRFGRDNLDDIVILRSNETPTYMFAVVVDDHDLGVNLVIRGNDHHTNTASQLMIYDRFGWERPSFAHLPLIHAEDGTKMSKRRHKVALSEFKDMGILPEAFNLYLMSLGWAKGDYEPDRLDDVIKIFDMKDVNKSGARFDQEKMKAVNARYLRSLPISTLAEHVTNFLNDRSINLGSLYLEVLKHDIGQILERTSTLGDIAYHLSYLRTDFLPKPSDDPTTSKQLARYLSEIDLKDWSEESIGQAIKAAGKENSVPPPQLWKAMRSSLTGIPDSYSILKIAKNLGPDVCLQRISESARS